MSVSLGNLSIEELIRRTGYNMSNEDIKILKNHRQDNARIDFNSDKFHIFDIPFSIDVAEPFYDELLAIFTKYNDIKETNEPLQIRKVVESEKEKQKRLKKEKEQQEFEELKANPNAIWLVKWHMLVPVKVNGEEVYYWCFINTYTTGRNNIPDIINGHATILLDENGIHGHFILDNPEIDDDADLHKEWRYVIGCGFVKLNGCYIGSCENATFETTDFSIKECIENYRKINDTRGIEIYFDKIKE